MVLSRGPTERQQRLAAKNSASGLRRAFRIATLDGAPAAEHPFANAFREAGFVATGGGLLLSLRDRGFEVDPETEPEIPLDLDEADAGG